MEAGAFVCERVFVRVCDHARVCALPNRVR